MHCLNSFLFPNGCERCETAFPELKARCWGSAGFNLSFDRFPDSQSSVNLNDKGNLLTIFSKEKRKKKEKNEKVFALSSNPIDCLMSCWNIYITYILIVSVVVAQQPSFTPRFLFTACVAFIGHNSQNQNNKLRSYQHVNTSMY